MLSIFYGRLPGLIEMFGRVTYLELDVMDVAACFSGYTQQPFHLFEIMDGYFHCVGRPIAPYLAIGLKRLGLDIPGRNPVFPQGI